MKKQFAIFILRWVAMSCGIWLAVILLSGVTKGAEPTIMSYVGAGFAFSMVNTLLKPIVTILSLPAIILTLGLFVLVVNGLMVYVALAFVPSLELTFFEAIIAGIFLSIINYIFNGLLDVHNERKAIRS
jgi:putative membrane protein